MGLLKKLNKKLIKKLPVSMERNGYTNKKQIFKDLNEMLGEDKSDWGRVHSISFRYGKWTVDRYPLDYKDWFEI